MITASDKAVKKLKEGLIQKCCDVGLGYRVVKSSDDSGHSTFGLKLDTEHPGDEVLMSHGIMILLGPTDAHLLEDYELDYTDEPNGGFCLKNEKAHAATRDSGGDEK